MEFNKIFWSCLKIFVKKRRTVLFIFFGIGRVIINAFTVAVPAKFPDYLLPLLGAHKVNEFCGQGGPGLTPAAGTGHDKH